MTAKNNAPAKQPRATSSKKKTVASAARDKANQAANYINFVGETIVFPENDKVLQFLREGWYEYSEQIFLFNYLHPGDTFIDGGAHAGMFSVLAKNRVGDKGRVIAIDPNIDILPYLEKNLGVKSQNIGHKWRNHEPVIILKHALGDKNGKATLFRGKVEKSAYASLYYSDDVVRPDEVDVITLNKLQSQLEISPVTLLKLDLEGGEGRALSKASKFLEANPDIVILMECSQQNQMDAGKTISGLGKQIAKLGFKITKFDADTCKLKPVKLGANEWYGNYVLTTDIKKANSRLSANLDGVFELSNDFLEKSRSAVDLYERAEAASKIGNILKDSIVPLASIHAAIAGDESMHDKVLERFKDYTKTDSIDEVYKFLEVFQDELGKISGGSAALSSEINNERTQLRELSSEKKILQDSLTVALKAAETNSHSDEAEQEINLLKTRIDELNSRMSQSEANKMRLELALANSDLLSQQLEQLQDHTKSINAELLESKNSAFNASLLKEEIEHLKLELAAQKQRWTMRNDFTTSRDEAYEQLLADYETVLNRLNETESQIRGQKKNHIEIETESARMEAENKVVTEDLQALTEKLSEMSRKSEITTSAHLHEVQEVTETLAAQQRLNEEQTAQMARLRKEQEALLEKIDIFRQARDEMVAELRSAHAEELSEVESRIANRDEALEAQRRLNEAMVAELRSQHAEELNEVGSKIANKDEALEAQHHLNEAMVAELRSKHANELSEAKAKIANKDEALNIAKNDINLMNDDKMVLSQQIERLTSSQENLAEANDHAQTILTNSSDSLSSILENLENSRLKMQSLIAETESAKKSRWVKFGRIVGMGPKDRLKTLTEHEHSIKSMLTEIATTMRSTTEQQLEAKTMLGGEGKASPKTISEPVNNDKYLQAVKGDIVEIGNRALALRRSKLLRVARLFGFKSAKVLDEMLEIYNGEVDK